MNDGSHWLCRCDCGNEKVVRGSSLKGMKVKSCGCLAIANGRLRALDIQGQKFGRLLAIRPTGARTGGSVVWECLCDCGATAFTSVAKLREGGTKSCGCLCREVHTTHGMSGSPEYRVWRSMLDRCSNPNSSRWHTHGSRGIKVCDSWSSSFDNFYKDMGSRPHDGLSLERVNNSGNYEPGNCKWGTATEQAENRRTTRLFTLDGTTQSLKAWCRALDIPYLRTYKRIFYANRSFEEAIL